MKKILSFIIITLALLILPCLAALADGFGVGYVTCDVLNVRDTPSASGGIVTKVYRGDELTLLYCNGYSWYYVELKDGTTGFCHAAYISTEKPGIDADAIIATAKSLLGRPYSYGASGPYAFDCSGFTSYVFAAHGISLPRSSAAQSGVGTTVSRSELRPGDLVFFATGSSGRVSHVGIYIGGGDIIHAATGQGKIVINNLSQSYYSSRYLWAKRVL